ncbi:FAD-dependent oxidoreductase [Agrobacterium sp. SOY23]|uniref:FAD-dependent oxidoreductase n=1 Tax=Agrobacterium sp. SOY23 TaxID=3014555 RepID=UPI0022AE7A05|nr:FAD-dependent oxidoreductase [Agrobacterium sp. SOY23]MCZ4433026.1 FAD-dependent oxidoreductase [Agrobacterium sp. SOY23]
MDAKRPSIAVVGSGPSGCYAAQFLRKKWPTAEIVIFEALPVPYGLVRYGVAPDHQGNKSVSQQFDRLFEREDVRFVGNVTVGTDISFEDLRGAFDVVILATGLASDRRLEIDGDLELCPIIGAGSLLKALNGHPLFDCPKDSSGSPRQLGSRVAVVGNGNVAMDAIRLLAKRDEHFDGSDIADARLKHLGTERITHIDVIGRSPAAAAKFDFSMLKEIVGLPHVRVAATGLGDDQDGQVSMLLSSLAQYSSGSPHAGEVNIRFHFNARPLDVQHRDGTSFLAMEQRFSSHRVELQVDAIVSAIGFENPTSTGAEWCGPNVFRVGWLNTGGKGAIAANRRDAKDVVDAIVQAVEAGGLSIGSGKSGPSWAEQVGDRAVAFNDWRKIDRWELANALKGRCRQKILDVSQMIDVAAS